MQPPLDLTVDELLAEAAIFTEGARRWITFAANPTLGIGRTEALVIAMRLLARAQAFTADALPY